MDVPIQKKNRKPWIIAAVVLVTLTLGVFYWLVLDAADALSMDRSELKIAKVFKGDFEDALIINGKIAPDETMVINAIEGGTVVEKFVENGAMVEKGQMICILQNPQSELNFLTQETGIIENINQLRTQIISLRNQTLEDEKEKILIENEFNLAQEKYLTDKRLFEAEIIPRTQFVQSKENFEYQKRRKQIVLKGAQNERVARNNQINQMQQTIGQQQKGLEILKRNKGNFVIRATASGRLSDFNPQLGQFVQSGQAIGKIDLMQSYKIIAEIDEYHLPKLKLGIQGKVVAGDKTYAITLSKILPEIENGKFTTEFLFSSDAPKSIKLGQKLVINLQLQSPSKEELLLLKGNFFAETSGKWVFVLKGNTAVKREIELGLENQNYYQVIAGLKEGDEVIVSSYDELKNFEQINVNN